MVDIQIDEWIVFMKLCLSKQRKCKKFVLHNIFANLFNKNSLNIRDHFPLTFQSVKLPCE